MQAILTNLGTVNYVTRFPLNRLLSMQQEDPTS
jgi:hypothetical protein